MSKLRCSCGHVIVDQTDDIPYKGYILPDTEVENVLTVLTDNIDNMLEAIKSNRREKWIRKFFSLEYPKDLQDSSMIYDLISSKIFSATQRIFECEDCGRIAIEIGQSNKFDFFVPDSDDTKGILNTKNKRDKF